MATLVKTIQTELLPITQVAAGAQQISGTLTSTTGLACTIFIDHANRSTTAMNKGVEYRIEVSQQASNNDTWVTLTSFVTSTTASVAGTVTATGGSAGAGTTNFTNTESFAQDDYLFYDNATGTLSEWAKVGSITSGSVLSLVDPLTLAHNSGTVYNQGQRFLAAVDLTALTRLRVVCNNRYQAGTTIAIACRVACITADSIA